MQADKVVDYIVNWLKEYSLNSGTKGFVIGVSGGVDSALTSTLCARTGRPVLLLNMPIYQSEDQVTRADNHIEWLTSNYDNVRSDKIDLSPIFKSMEDTFPKDIQDELSMANARARLRMTTLYTYAGHHKLLVAGTGNKVEDFGVGFYTKYGDGGVDISPIADLYKTEVFELANHVGIDKTILNAAPTDGLYGDEKTDEMQIGATYPELEWAMEFIRKREKRMMTKREQEVMAIYQQRHKANLHKMAPIPVCIIPKDLQSSPR